MRYLAPQINFIEMTIPLLYQQKICVHTTFKQRDNKEIVQKLKNKLFLNSNALIKLNRNALDPTNKAGISANLDTSNISNISNRSKSRMSRLNTSPATNLKQLTLEIRRQGNRKFSITNSHRSFNRLLGPTKEKPKQSKGKVKSNKSFQKIEKSNTFYGLLESPKISKRKRKTMESSQSRAQRKQSKESKNSKIKIQNQKGSFQPSIRELEAPLALINQQGDFTSEERTPKTPSIKNEERNLDTTKDKNQLYLMLGALRILNVYKEVKKAS